MKGWENKKGRNGGVWPWKMIESIVKTKQEKEEMEGKGRSHRRLRYI